MNPMIAALQKSRSEGPAALPPAGPDGAPAEAPAPAGDAIVEKFAAMDAKLDQILKLLGADQNQGAPADEVAPEAPPNDDGN